MTTGEKLAKLRKESNLTQEELAEKLYVTRQSVSKWEQDLAFPETDKLVQIARLYNCSVDYLLGNTAEEAKQNINTIKETGKFQEIIERKTFFTSAWSVAYFFLMLIMYALPYVSGKLQLGFGLADVIVNFNVYKILFASNPQVMNLFMIIAFLLLIAQLVLGILISFLDNLDKLYRYRRISAIIETAIWLFLFIGVITSFMIGALFVLALSAANLICLYKVDKNKFQ